MHVLVVAATNVRTSDAPFLLTRALERQAGRATLLPLDDHLPVLAEIGYGVGGFGDGLYRAAMQRHVRRTAARLAPDVVLVYGSNWALEPATIDHLRAKLGCTVVLWEINQRVFGDRAQVEALPRYDHVFCLDSAYVDLLRAQGLGCVEHLCAAADPDEHRPIELSDDEAERYVADVSFIGTHHPAREEALRAIGEATDDVRIYGFRWDDAGPDVRPWIRPEPVYGRKKTLIYAASRLSFHVRGPHMLRGENFRVFEVAACGGVTLAGSSPDLERCFEIGEEVIVFDDLDDLRKATQHFLTHPDELEAIRTAGRARVLADHTYDHRARAIVDHIDACAHRGRRSAPASQGPG